MSAVSATAELFLKSSNWKENIPGVLKSLGQAADVSRAHVILTEGMTTEPFIPT